MENSETKSTVWNKKLVAAVAIILVVALLAGIGGGFAYRQKHASAAVQRSNETYKSLDAGFSDVKITNKKTALQAVDSVKDQVGLSDVDAELKVTKVNKSGGNKYYRCQQYYNDVPVYGRQVVVGADEDGDSLSLTTNIDTVDEDIDVEPSVDESTVETNVSKELKGADLSGLADLLTTANLYIYNFLKDGAAALTYALDVQAEDGKWTAIVDAHTGEVLDLLSQTFTSSASVKDADGDRFTAAYDRSEKVYLLENESLNTYVATFDGADSNADAPCIFIESEDNVFGNTEEEKALEYGKGADYYRAMTEVQTQFKKLYGARTSLPLVALYNDGAYDGDNGYASYDIMSGSKFIPDGTVVGVVSIGSQKDVTTVDLLAHEYMHRVEQEKVGMHYRQESGALMEAYSDIFGELVEAAANGEADWVHNGIRSLKEPSDTGNPSEYAGAHWGSTSSDSDHGNVHNNSTVLSHAAYLMVTGVEDDTDSDGSSGSSVESSKTAVLSYDALGALFMESLSKFTQDETFQQAASAIYSTAKTQASCGKLSDDQVATVASALAAVGLPVTEDTQPTKKSAGLVNTSKTLTVPKMLERKDNFYFYTNDSNNSNHSKTTYEFDIDAKTVEITTNDDSTNLLGLLDLSDLANMTCLLADINDLQAQDYTPFLAEKDYLILCYSKYIQSGMIENVVVHHNVKNWDYEIIYNCEVEDGLLKNVSISKSGDVYSPDSFHYYYDKNRNLIRYEKVYNNEESLVLSSEFEYDTKGCLKKYVFQGYEFEKYTETFTYATNESGQIIKRFGDWNNMKYEYENGCLTKVSRTDIQDGQWEESMSVHNDDDPIHSVTHSTVSQSDGTVYLDYQSDFNITYQTIKVKT